MFGKQNGFTNIPLRRRIEALALTLVTVLASASVDWSSLTARAEDTYTNNLTVESTNPITSSNTQITVERTFNANNEELSGDKPYEAIMSAYMKILVSSSSEIDFTVDTYRYEEGTDYTKGEKEEGIGGGQVGGYETNQYSSLRLFSRSADGNGNKPFYLAKGECLTVVVTFSNIPADAQMNYMVDPDTKSPVQFTSEFVPVPYDVSINGPSGYTMVAGQTVNDTRELSLDFSVTPAYKREIQYHLYDGTASAYETAIAGGTPAFSDTETNKPATLDTTGKVLTAGNVSGEETLVAYINDPVKKYITVPVRVVQPTAYSGLTYNGKAISAPVIKCGNNNLQEGQDFTAVYVRNYDDGTTGQEQSREATIDAGNYTMTVTGKGTYAGFSYTEDFTISKKNISSWTAAAEKLKINPESMTIDSDTGVLTDADRSSEKLIEGTDYEMTSIERQAGQLKQYTVELSGIGNYTGKIPNLTVSAANGSKIDISKAVRAENGVILDKATNVYDANAITDPGIHFYDQTNTELKLTQGTHYEYRILDENSVLVYDSAAAKDDRGPGAINAGTYTVEINGIGDDFTGTITTTFAITPRPLQKNNILVQVSPTTLNYTGSVVVPSTVNAWYLRNDNGSLTRVPMVRDQDFEAVFPESIEAKTYLVSIKGKGNYTTETENGGILDFIGDKAADDTELINDEDKIHKESQVTYKIIPTLDSATVILGDDAAHLDTAHPTDKDKGWVSKYTTIFDGKEKKPAVKVLISGKELKSAPATKPDYEVSYNTSINAGTGSLIISGRGDYKGYGDLLITYTIAPKTIATDAFKITTKSTKTYSTGTSGITLDSSEYSVTDDEKTLTEGTDYTLSYEDNKAAGTATVTAEGTGNYQGTSSATFKIEAKKFDSDYSIDPIGAQRYTGSPLTPDVSVRYKNGTTLTKDKDFKIKEYKSNTDASIGKATVIVEGTGNYSGTLSATFNITSKSLTDDNMTYEIGTKKAQKLRADGNVSAYHQEYKQGLKRPTYLYIYDSGTRLTEGTTGGTDGDYEVVDETGTDAIGEHTLKIVGRNNYAGSEAEITYFVIAKDINNIAGLKVVSLSATEYSKVKEADKSSVLTTGTDIKRYYQVQNSKGEAVNATTTDASSNELPNYTWTWTDPNGKALKEGEVPTVAGSGWSLVLTGKNNYRNSTKAITADSTGKPFAVGASLDVNGIVDLAEKEGTEVPFLGSNMPVVAVDPSALTKTASTGAEFGDVNGYNTNVSFEGTSGTTMVGPSYTSGKYVNGKTGQDYTIEYVDDSGNVLTSLPVGTSFKVRISAVEGSTRFFGSHTILNARTVKANTLLALAARSKLTVSDPKSTTSYVKDPADSSNDTKLSYSYTGSSITPSLTVRIEPQATDKETGFKGTFAPIDLANYGFTYATDNTDTAVLPSNVTSGSHNIQVTGTGASITGTTNVPYEITAREITSDMVSLQTPTKASYNGKSHKDEIIPVVKDGSNVLKAGTDYVVEYYSGTSWGDAQPINNDEKYKTVGKIFVKIVNLTTSQNYKVASDSIKIDTPFEIEGKDIADLTVSLDNSYKTEGESYYSKQYTGSELKPKVSVKDGATDLAENTDFTVAYSENTDIGTATVTVSGTGNYSGTKTLHFYIYGQLTDSAASPGFFVATDIDTADATYVLNDKGKPAKTDGTVLDYRTVAFQDSGKAFTIKGAQYYSITVKKIVNGSTYSATDIAGPAKYQITYKGNGKEKGLTGDATYTITVQGDLATATISGYRDNYDHVYDYAGPNETPGPKDKSGLTVMLSGGYVLGSAEYTLIPNADKHSPNDGEASFTIKPSDSYSAYYTSNGDRQVPFKIRYNLSTLTVTASDTNAPVIGDDLQKIIDNNEIKVTSAGIELTVNTDYTITNAVWQTIPTNGVAKLRVTLAPDNGGTKSYNTKTYTVNGQTKDWSQINISQEGEKEKTYDGEDVFSTINENIVVTDGDGNTLTKDQDYTVTWKEGTEKTGKTVTSIKDAGTYTAWIKGINKYFTQDFVTGKTNLTYKINPKPLSGNVTMTLDDENVKYYSGSDPKATYTLTDNALNTTLNPGTDYTFGNPTVTPDDGKWAVGTVIKYKATGTGNYTGDLEAAEIKIEAADINVEGVVTVTNDTHVYDGDKHEPEFIVKRGDNTLTKDIDYEVKADETDADLVNVGTHGYTITGKGNYTNTKKITYTITPRPLTSVEISANLDLTKWDYTGSAITPTVTVTDALSTITDQTLTKDTDYTVTVTNNIASHSDDNTDGKAPVVTIAGIKNYSGTIPLYFQIGTSIADAKVTLTKPASFEYDGEAHTPTIASISAGSASYAGSDIAKVATITYKDADGNAVTDPTEVGTYTVVVTGTGPFFGTNEKATFEITSKNIKTREITVNILEDDAQHKDGDDVYYYYTGEEIKPGVEVIYQPTGGTEQTLSPDTDYDVAYKYNKDASDNAQIIVTMKGNYKGSYKTYFSIRSIDISSFKVTLDEKVMDFTGDALTPGFTISGKNAAGEDFERSSVDTDLEAEGLEADWSANIAPGTASLIVTGTGNYTGSTAAASMTIVGELDENTVKANDVFRTGSAITPDITVDFVDSEGESHVMPASWYTVSKVSPVGGSWAKATEYTALVKPTKEGKSFLVPATGYRVTGKLTDEIRGLKIDGYNATYQYTGAKIQPSTLKVVSTTGASLPTGATVTFTETGLNGGDCIRPNTTVQITAKVSYKNADGTTTSVDVENGKYSTEDNKKPATFNIVKRPIKACTFQGPSDTRYTGSALSPIFSIHTEAAQLRNGTDYTYTIRNNVRPGTATVTIRGIGNYIGTTTRTFNIYVASPTQLSVSSRSGSNATIRWKAVAHADGYRVTYISASGVRKYTTTNTSMSLTNLKTSGSTQVTVEAYVANGAGNPAWYSNPAAVYIR